MARTVRRTEYVARTVTRGCIYKGGCYKLEGEELSKALCEWHRDRQQSNIYNPSKYFRRVHQKCLRVHQRRELHEFLLNPEHEVSLLAKPPLPCWD